MWLLKELCEMTPDEIALGILTAVTTIVVTVALFYGIEIIHILINR